jgi:hypothetical protein
MRIDKPARDIQLLNARQMARADDDFKHRAGNER